MKNTREELLREASRVVGEQGVFALSMRKLASSVGISPTAIYRHFQDKDELASQLVLESFRHFGSYLKDSERSKKPLLRFRRIAQRYFDFSQEHENEYRLIFMTDRELLGFDRLDEDQVQEVSAPFEMLVERVQECQDAGLFMAGEPRLLAAIAWSAFHGLASLLMTGSLGVSNADAQKIASFQMQRLEASLLVPGVQVDAPQMKISSRPAGKKNRLDSDAGAQESRKTKGNQR
ncbi:MAG: TetR/AcrR family transcriptional regulator [Polyangiaceae bacterium]|nr:TetR/AcrR family transcriptional regulator [Polyangiaceae bacterium]